jgi:hypothetical protein
MNIHIAQALERLQTEQDVEIQRVLVDDTISVFTAMLPTKINSWDQAETLQVGIHFGASAAFVLSGKIGDAIGELQKLNGYFAEGKHNDG